MSFTLAFEKLKFRDGTSLTVNEATWLEDTRLLELEEQGRDKNAAELAAIGERELTKLEQKVQFFRLNIYPKMAACSEGDVPSEEEARRMPSTELNKWYAAAKKVNPDWFAVFDQAVNQTAEQLAAEQKKSEKKRPK